MSKTATLVRGVLLSLAVLVSAMGLGVSQPVAAELKLAHFMSPKHPMDKFVMRPWSKKVAELSGGKLTVQIFPGGALGAGGPPQFGRAVDGVADITFGLQGFTSDLFPRTRMVELPGLSGGAAHATNAMWDAYDLISSEYSRVKVLALWVNDEQILMSKKPIRTLADLKGLKVRVPTKTQAKTIEALGGVPVFMGITDTYSALDTGVIDVIMSGGSTIKSFKFGEVAKYFTVGLPINGSTFFLVMNKAAYEGLPADQRAIIDQTTGRELSLQAAAFYGRAGKGSLKKVGETPSLEVIELSPAEVEKGVALLNAARKTLVAEFEAKGIPANDILKAMGYSN